MTAPHFSIIMPVFNAAQTVAATIRSVLQQDEASFELIIIDDGSTDTSLSILQDFAAADHRIRLIAQDNMGVSATRNFGILQARAPLIAFLDADDLWHPDKLAQHKAFHDAQPDVSASYARIAFVDPDALDARLARTFSGRPRGMLGVADLLAENPVCTMSNLVVTRDCLDTVGGFRPQMSFAEDQEWLARAAHQGHAIEGIDAVLVDYRLSPDGLSVNLEQMYAGWRKLVVEFGPTFDREAAEAVYCRYLSRRALRSGAKPQQALHYAWRGLSLNASAFLADARRGWMTLASAVAAPFLPRATRLRLFA